MKYFSGIDFLHGGNAPYDTAFFTRKFEGYCGIQYNHSGNFIYARENENHKVYSGAFAFITYPGITFRYGALEGESRNHSHLCFKGERVDYFINNGLMTLPTDPVRILNPDLFLSSLKRCVEYFKRGANFTDRAVLMLEDLLLQIHESKDTKLNPHNRFSAELEQLISKVRSNPQINWDFSLEAKKMNISYPHFRRIFHDYLHVAPQSFVIRCRLDLAAEMLRENNDQIAYIAEDCGVGQLHYFSRLFKKHFSISPSEYRREFSGF